MEFSSTLIQWYSENKRDLPWRNTTDAYKIWLSEIILQQTRVSQGLPYYEKFVAQFPTVIDLANAAEQDVLKLWQGLGYYSRARNLHQTAKIVVVEYQGVFPTSYNELLKLKGIGTYTAAAIASFSSNESVTVVDGNVFRVLARIFNVDLDIAAHSAKKYFQELAQELLKDTPSSPFNQAIMEFGALQCVPKNPKCDTCVFNDRCEALRLNKIDLLPVKLKKIKITKRFFNYLIIEDVNGNIIVNKRTDKDIWRNLYEFPLIEKENLDENLIREYVEKEFSLKDLIFVSSEMNSDIKHKLSHQELYIKFFKIVSKVKIKDAISIHEMVKLPFPIVIYSFIERELVV